MGGNLQGWLKQSAVLVNNCASGLVSRDWGWNYIQSDIILRHYHFFPHGASASGPEPTHYRGFTVTIRHITLDRDPLDLWWVRRRDLYLTPHITHKRQTSMLPAGFEPPTKASAQPHTHNLERAATGTGHCTSLPTSFKNWTLNIALTRSWVRART